MAHLEDDPRGGAKTKLMLRPKTNPISKSIAFSKARSKKYNKPFNKREKRLEKERNRVQVVNRLMDYATGDQQQGLTAWPCLTKIPWKKFFGHDYQIYDHKIFSMVF